MRVRCTEGRYVNPQFTLETGDISPDLTPAVADQIMKDFSPQFEEASDEQFNSQLKKKKKEARTMVATEQQQVNEANLRALRESEDSTRKEMINALKEAGYSNKEIAKLVKEKEQEITEPTDRQAPDMTVERSGDNEAKKESKKKGKGES